MSGTLKIIKRDITTLDVDCIVNAANAQLQHGGGVCGAIFTAAGAKELQYACNKIGFCGTGYAVTTPGFHLKAKYIIHAVGPKWIDGMHGEEKLLYRCYQAAMQEAYYHQCHSIACPLISSGIYGYPVKEAWEIAIRSIRDFQHAHKNYSLDVFIAVLDEKALHLGNAILAKYSSGGGFQFFWHEYEAYGILSQWFPCEIVVEGIRYATCEQYMMAKKALLARDLQYYALIMCEPDPQKCKKLGRAVRNLDVDAWDHCKGEVVYHANMAKFAQNSQARYTLLSTDDKILAEANPHDIIWGIGLDACHPDSMDPSKWRGQNLLGKILMQVRDKIRAENK